MIKELLSSRRFAPLFWSQFCSALNDNVLKNAPHTHRLLLEEWTRPYSKEKAFFPLKSARDDKY